MVVGYIPCLFVENIELVYNYLTFDVFAFKFDILDKSIKGYRSVLNNHPVSRTNGTVVMGRAILRFFSLCLTILTLLLYSLLQHLPLEKQMGYQKFLFY